MAAAPMLDSTFGVDKLTYEIFSILENKFLFGYEDQKLFVSGKQEIPVETLKSGENVSGKVRILSIDGGGATDGILAGKSLVHLEAYLRKKSGNTDARISDYFDVVAGTGTGGILAALLFTRGKDGRSMFTADEALRFLIDNRRKISHSSPAGAFRRIFRSSNKVEKLFRRTFGDSTLKDTVKPALIPCYDLSTRAPFLFSRADALETDGYDFKMREICAATSADPTVMSAVEMRSVDQKTSILAVDGGVAMNNPTAAAITHVLNNKHEFPFCDGVEDLLVVSLGNGESDSGSRKPKLSAAEFVTVAGEGASDMVDQSVSMAFNHAGTSNYVRIQTTGFDVGKFLKNSKSAEEKGEVLLGIAEEMLKHKNVESILFRGKKIIQNTNSEKLDWFAGELIKEHERRKTSILPTVIFKQAVSPRTSSATVSTESSY
ncbi:patatin-like protein 6 [Telopea speciosissima]|uniref:patatin-like protein 6 n=1 Tax=Telopea speciosissima TaxID=54955 RepID=UPI001CC631A0|nr:patatin-like protein 6 [Telopea speciosissima]